MVRRGSSSFKRRSAWTHTRGSVRRVSGFVLTGHAEVGLFGVNLISSEFERLLAELGFELWIGDPAL